MESRRAEAFSDGVFAIAITLLVLDLRLPGAGPEHYTLIHQLLHDWPQYFAYVVSFLTIGIMWMNHHTIFAHVTRVDRWPSRSRPRWSRSTCGPRAAWRPPSPTGWC
jgi:uncharacterized membrane protein